jgi:hypothetical protein
MNILTLKDVSLLGDYDEEWGQTFWCVTEEGDMPIKFNKRLTNIALGTRITYEESTVKKDKNGHDYMALKKVSVEEGAGTPAETIPFVEQKKPEPKFAGKDEPPVFREDNKYLKDVSDIPRSLVIELLKYYDVQSLYNSTQYTNMIKLAQSLNDDIVAMIDGNRNSGSQATSDLITILTALPTQGQATNEPESQPAVEPIHAKLQKGFSPTTQEISEEELASMERSL